MIKMKKNFTYIFGKEKVKGFWRYHIDVKYLIVRYPTFIRYRKLGYSTTIIYIKAKGEIDCGGCYLSNLIILLSNKYEEKT